MANFYLRQVDSKPLFVYNLFMNFLPQFENSRIEKDGRLLPYPLTWHPQPGEVWLILSPNGGGKAFLADALAGTATVDGVCLPPEKRAAVVSLEAASALIEEERKNDDSDFVEGGVDIGRTVYRYLECDRTVSEQARRMIGLLDLERIAGRGLKYLSTGEIRRTLLAKAFLSGKQLLVLSDPFAGLDSESRKTLASFFELAGEAWKEHRSRVCPVFFMERFCEVPDCVNRVLAFSEGQVVFCGDRRAYEAEPPLSDKSDQQRVAEMADRLELMAGDAGFDAAAPLVEMKNVTVHWDGETILDRLNWTVHAGEHWLIRGPNGCGKTTLMELITGDNPQLYANEIYLFGRKRGTGESVWDIKRKLGMVSYRLHLEYRMVGSSDLEAVVLSGFYDSVGLYCSRTDSERQAASAWLAFGGFGGREGDSFSSLTYGEQRLLLILRAVVKAPPLLILDEPCHGLDESNRAKVLALLQRIAERKITTLLHVTHEPDEVLPCEHHILEMERGGGYRLLTK